MRVMAFTSADLDAIDRAIASGELTVTVEGKSVTYRSLSDLQRARELIQSSLAASAGGTARAYPRYQLADFSDD